jgi:hypothetical protein
VDGEAKDKLVKRKVRAYPIEATLEVNAEKKPIEVVFLAPAGLIAVLHTLFVQVGDHCTISFELPVLNRFVTTPVRVLKTYDKAVNPKEHIVERMAEFHFQKLTDEHKAHILSFLSAIGQKPTLK